jgi:hypothetical protein
MLPELETLAFVKFKPLDVRYYMSVLILVAQGTSMTGRKLELLSLEGRTALPQWRLVCTLTVTA